MLEADIARSRAVTPEEIADQPFWFPLATSTARLMSPVL